MTFFSVVKDLYPCNLSIPKLHLSLHPMSCCCLSGPPPFAPVQKAPPRRKQSPQLFLLSQIMVLQSQFSTISCILPSFLVACDGRIDLLLFALDWREQIFIFMLTLEPVNPAQAFAQDVASHGELPGGQSLPAALSEPSRSRVDSISLPPVSCSTLSPCVCTAPNRGHL